MANSEKVFIAYITEGREKYYYDTTFIGVFRNKKDAMMKLYEKLWQKEYILCPYYNDSERAEEIADLFKVEESYNRYKECERDDPFPFHLLDEDFDLEYLIDSYDDSYRGDGWDYTIKEVKIK